MRILIHLDHPVPAFSPRAAQLTGLAARVPCHELCTVHEESAFREGLAAADAAVVWRFEQPWYREAPRLRHLFTPSAGREPFGPDPRGLVELHFGRFHGAIMAESLLSMLAFMNRRMGAALAAQAERRWDREPYSECRRLYGQTVLMIGLGAIGEQCARLLSALGMVVWGVRRDISRPSPWAVRLFTPEQRFEAVAAADHVVCVLPGDTGSDRFLDAAAFSHMKGSAYVYNLGRGNAIDVDALAVALQKQQIAGAFLDVVPDEPLPASSPLWTAPNLYLTPHASAINVEYLDLYFDELANELVALS